MNCGKLRDRYKRVGLIRAALQLVDRCQRTPNRSLIQVVHQNNIAVLRLLHDDLLHMIGIAVLPVLGVHAPVDDRIAKLCGYRLDIRVDAAAYRTQHLRCLPRNILDRIGRIVNLAADVIRAEAGQVAHRMIHGVVAQLMAFVYHARQHIRYLGDTLTDHQKRSNRAALLEAVQQIVGQAVRIAVLFAGRTVVKRQRDINIGLRNIAVHGIAQLILHVLEVGLLAVKAVKRYAGEREYAVTEIGIRLAKDRRKHLRRNVKTVLVLIRVGGEAIAGGTLAVHLGLAVIRIHGRGGFAAGDIPCALAVVLGLAAERGHRSLERDIRRAVLIEHTCTQLFAFFHHVLGAAFIEQLIRAGSHNNAAAHHLSLGRAEHLERIIRNFTDLLIGQRLFRLTDDDQIAVFSGNLAGLPRKCLTDILDRRINHAVLLHRCGGKGLGRVTDLQVCITELDCQHGLFERDRAGFGILVPVQLQSEVIAQRADGRHAVALTVTVGRSVNLYRLAVLICIRVSHLIHQHVVAADHVSDNRADRPHTKENDRNDQNDQGKQHTVVTVAPSASAPSSMRAARRLPRRFICHFCHPSYPFYNICC